MSGLAQGDREYWMRSAAKERIKKRLEVCGTGRLNSMCRKYEGIDIGKHLDFEGAGGTMSGVRFEGREAIGNQRQDWCKRICDRWRPPRTLNVPADTPHAEGEILPKEHEVVPLIMKKRGD